MNEPILAEYTFPSGAVRPAIIARATEFSRADLHVFPTAEDADDVVALGCKPGGPIYLGNVARSDRHEPGKWTLIATGGRRVT